VTLAIILGKFELVGGGHEVVPDVGVIILVGGDLLMSLLGHHSLERGHLILQWLHEAHDLLDFGQAADNNGQGDLILSPRSGGGSRAHGEQWKT
jgi:hypothetical protein